MDEEERITTNIIQVLLEKSVLTFGGVGLGGLLLGPEGLAIGGFVAAGVHLLTAGNSLSSWQALKAAKGWAQLVAYTLVVAAKLAIQNWQKLHQIALTIARLIERIFRAEHCQPVSY